MGDFQRIRPFKILAVVMVTVAVVLTVVSLAGPDWVTATFYEGDVQSWGLWWDCFRVYPSFEMCLDSDWLAACGTMVLLSLIADVVSTGLGVYGLCVKRRLPYILAGIGCLVSGVCMIISLIIYPVMFAKEVKEDSNFHSETSNFVFDWTYGIGWGTICFLTGGAIFFFLRVKEEDDAQPMTLSSEKHLTYTYA